MKILFTCCPAPAHLYPLVPLAWALRSAGHTVLVGTAENFRPVVNEAGLPAATVADPVDLVAWLRPPEGGPFVHGSGRDRALRHSGYRFGELAVRSLPGTARLVETWRPDLVVAEPVEFAGPVAAAAAGVSWVRHLWGLAMREEIAGAAAAAFPLRAAKDGLPAPALTVDVCPRSLQYPAVRDAVNVAAMRYVPYNGPAALPGWLLGRPPRPRVCLTLGTILARDPAAGGPWRTALRTFTDLGAEVLVAIDDRHRDVLGDLPDGVRLGRLPLAETLRSCAAIVHHGGSGTTMTAAACGVPQLVLPHFADQFGNADRVSGAGAGLSLTPEQVSEQAVVAACRALLDDDALKDRARALAAENAERHSPAEVVDLLEEYR
ncbi:nucleotide disphospho-sugar-binding domain-containing protein [Actinomadura chokoriensis]|uniref:DUF1205 domain-containing protein n=1 Tax=Actinomadura chokoriensis TaxID=454156 RepID=A0ABV4R4J0_9ACTN